MLLKKFQNRDDTLLDDRTMLHLAKNTNEASLCLGDCTASGILDAFEVKTEFTLIKMRKMIYFRLYPIRITYSSIYLFSHQNHQLTYFVLNLIPVSRNFSGIWDHKIIFDRANNSIIFASQGAMDANIWAVSMSKLDKDGNAMFYRPN